MNKLLILGLALASLVCLASSKTITVKVVEGYASAYHRYPELVSVDDGIKVRDLANQALRQIHPKNLPEVDNLRLENRLMITYNMDKTLKEAGIKDGSKVILKYWSTKNDLEANIFDRLMKDDDDEFTW